MPVIYTEGCYFSRLSEMKNLNQIDGALSPAYKASEIVQHYEPALKKLSALRSDNNQKGYSSRSAYAQANNLMQHRICNVYSVIKFDLLRREDDQRLLKATFFLTDVDPFICASLIVEQVHSPALFCIANNVQSEIAATYTNTGTVVLPASYDEHNIPVGYHSIQVNGNSVNIRIQHTPLRIYGAQYAGPIDHNLELCTVAGSYHKNGIYRYVSGKSNLLRYQSIY